MQIEEIGSLETRKISENYNIDIIKDLSASLQRDMNWLEGVIKFAYHNIVQRMQTQLNINDNSDIENQYSGFNGIPPYADNDCIYDRFILKHQLNDYERLAICLAIAPCIKPEIFDLFFVINSIKRTYFSEIGGVFENGNKRFVPTLDTVLFLTAGYDLEKRLFVNTNFSTFNKLFENGIISLSTIQEDYSDKKITPGSELLSLISGKEYSPAYTNEFPAKELKTKMEWDDLVLRYETWDEIEELKIWLKHGKRLLENNDLSKKIKPGYRSMFYGPSGTGKTLTAALIGKELNMPVYRIDLSMVVSKWVGETEKNLRSIFDLAQNKNWILFFDEADSLFSKRTNVSSSNDRYANQEVSYLLQRIEDFPGMVILATNLKGNMDEAFTRRFQSIIHFPMPDYDARKQLWLKAFPPEFALQEGIDLQILARNYEMTGASIVNVASYCCLMAINEGVSEITGKNLEKAMRKEFKKEGKTLDRK